MHRANSAEKTTVRIMAFDLNTGEPKWKLTGESPGYSSPVLMTFDGLKQIVALTEKKIVGLAAADGKLLWQLPFETKRKRSYNSGNARRRRPNSDLHGRGPGCQGRENRKTRR